MDSSLWYVLFGLIFFLMGFGNPWIHSAPLSSSIIYLILGILLGPEVFGVLNLKVATDYKLLEYFSEFAVIISLFTAGLKLKLPLKHHFWKLPLLLATCSMVVTISLVAIVANYFFNFPWGGAILLGAILAATDPVLASDVQVKHPNDKNKLRFTLTGEAGLNDGTAFPFVLLGLGFLGLHPLGEAGLSWVFKDLLWPVIGGVVVGVLIAFVIHHLDQILRKKTKEAKILDEFMNLSMIGLSYGIALKLETYGFLAVFATAITIRQLELKKSSLFSLSSEELSSGVLKFNEQMEHLCEGIIVILVGSFITPEMFTSNLFILAFFLLIIIRPIAVVVNRSMVQIKVKELYYLSWFGIRGIGSLYYLTHAISLGLEASLALRITSLTLGVIAISTIIHGISATPLMKRYQ